MQRMPERKSSAVARLLVTILLPPLAASVALAIFHTVYWSITASDATDPLAVFFLSMSGTYFVALFACLGLGMPIWLVLNRLRLATLPVIALAGILVAYIPMRMFAGHRLLDMSWVFFLATLAAGVIGGIVFHTMQSHYMSGSKTNRDF